METTISSSIKVVTTKTKRYSLPASTAAAITSTTTQTKTVKLQQTNVKGKPYNVHEFIIKSSSATDTDDAGSYGFTLAGYCPCHVASVAQNSIAYLAGVEKFDLIMKINDVNCCRATLKTCLSLIRNSPVAISLTVYRFNDPKLITQMAKTLRKTPSLKTISKKKTKPKKPAAAKTAETGRSFGLARFFQPSKWLPCGTNFKLNGCGLRDSSQLNQTCYSCKKPAVFDAKKNSASQLTTKTTPSIADTGYDTASETATSKTKKLGSTNEERTDAVRMKLIENLLEMETSFITYLSMGVAQLARPLRGFLMKQQDYFILFQNIEKILIISENFMRSMDKWSSLDLYTRIGQLYTQKLNLFREAFTIYAKGHATSRCLLGELKSHCQQFRMFLNETQSGSLTLSNLIDMPLVHIHETLGCFKTIKKFTTEINQSSPDTPHIDVVIADLRKILSHASLADDLSLDRNGEDEGGGEELKASKGENIKKAV